MRLGRAEKAGSGVNKIVSGWRYLEWPVPTVTEDARQDYIVQTIRIGKSDEDDPQESPTRRI